MIPTKKHKNKKSQQKPQKSVVRRIPIYVDRYISSQANGDFKSGLSQIVGWHKALMKDPKQVLMNDIESLVEHARELLPENHFEHFVNSQVPHLLVGWVKTGRVDPSLLRAPNKSIDEFAKDKNEKKKVISVAEATD